MIDDLDPVKVSVQGVRKYVYPPTTGYYENTRAPTEKLELDWVFGYRGHDVSTNLWFLEETGELLFFIGAMAVLYDRLVENQRVYEEHNEDIQCMDLHPNRKLVVTGQKAGKTAESRAHFR